MDYSNITYQPDSVNVCYWRGSVKTYLLLMAVFYLLNIYVYIYSSWTIWTILFKLFLMQIACIFSSDLYFGWFDPAFVLWRKNIIDSTRQFKSIGHKSADWLLPWWYHYAMKNISKIPLLFHQLSYRHHSVKMTHDTVYFKAIELQIQLFVRKVIQVKSNCQRRRVQNSTMTFRTITLLLRRYVLLIGGISSTSLNERFWLLLLENK